MISQLLPIVKTLNTKRVLLIMSAIVSHRIAFCLMLTTGVIFFSEQLAQAQMFAPPNNPAPATSKGGGVRTGDQCFSDATTDSPTVTPLLPATEIGLTVAEHPMIFVYIPNSSVKQAFFSLQDEAGNQHYQTQFSLPQKSGVIGIQVPNEAPPLEIGTKYQWSFVMICGEQLEPDSPSVTGWVERTAVSDPTWMNVETVGATLELASSLGQAGLWYDMLAALAQLRQTQPDDSNIAQIWETELTSAGLGAIANQPLVNSAR